MLVAGRTRPSPHFPAGERASCPRGHRGGNALPRAAFRRVSYGVTQHRQARSNRSLRWSSRSFFPAIARSIVLGCSPESEFLLNQLQQLSRSNRLARDELLLDEGQHVALKLMGTVRTALLGYQPSHAALVEVGLGLIVGRPRHAVLLGGVPATDVFSMETWRSISYRT